MLRPIGENRNELRSTPVGNRMAGGWHESTLDKVKTEQHPDGTITRATFGRD
jgi:hypothetical protein